MNAQNILIELLLALTAGLCFFIAGKLGKRKLKAAGDQLAWKAFRLWWLGIGVTTLLSALRPALPMLGVTSVGVYVWQGLLNLLVISVALWGLLFYLVYLYSGKQSWARPLAVFYVLFFISLAAYSFSLQPTGVQIDQAAATATVQYANTPSPIYGLAIALVLLAPQIIASLVYFSLVFRVRERVQRYRVLLVSLSIFVWFTSPFLAGLLKLTALPWWPVASRAIGLIAALVIYWAYYPPKFIQKWLHVASI